MTRKHRRLVLALFLALTGCAVSAPSDGVRSGLEHGRPLADLDEDEVATLCEAQLAHLDAALAEVGGVWSTACIGVIREAPDRASCETRHAECVADLEARLDIATMCERDAHTVPDCDPSATVGLVESCATQATLDTVDLGIDCSLAGEAEEIAARLNGVALPPGCDILLDRACAIFAPTEAE